MTDTITITGNVATEPEQRRAGDALVATFRVASPQRRFDRGTQMWVDGETNWYTVSAYRGLAQHVLDSLHKREPVLITGRLRIRTWENGDKKGTAVDIDADAIGHDLRWGNSSFSKQGGARPADPVTAWDTAVPPTDGWATPGLDAATPGSPGAASADGAGPTDRADDVPPPSDALALVGADAETPF